MATIKSYSDLQQSKKLTEILPFESADYHYIAQGEKSYFYPYSLSSDAVKDYDEELAEETDRTRRFRFGHRTVGRGCCF